MPKRKHPPGTYWRGDTLYSKIMVRGQLVRRPLGTDDPRVATRRLEALRKELTARLKYGEATRSMVEVIGEWQKHAKAHVAARTFDRYMTSLAMIAPWLSGKMLGDINGPLIAEIIAGRRGTVTTATIKRDLGALSQVMGYAMDEGWIEANPVLPRLGRLKERRDPISLPDPAHIHIVAKRANGRLRDLVYAAWLTGCRQAELTTAKASQFDAKKLQLTVIGKRNKRRTITVTMEAAASLAPGRDDVWLFQSTEGGPHRSIRTRWQEMVHGRGYFKAGHKNDGIRVFRFHDLRHRFAVEYLKSGGSIYDLKEHLGHTSVKTTEIYLEHLTGDEKRMAMGGHKIRQHIHLEDLEQNTKRDTLQ